MRKTLASLYNKNNTCQVSTEITGNMETLEMQEYDYEKKTESRLAKNSLESLFQFSNYLACSSVISPPVLFSLIS